MQTHGNIVLEVSWTIIPFLILAVMAVPTVATIFDLAKIPKGPDVVHIEVDGRQWFWQYTYTDKDTQFFTANEMHIPVDRPVLLTLTSNNVIHSFWVPELAGKKDVVPGHPNTLTIEADRPGTFLGQCAEYCGISHANMRLRVIAADRGRLRRVGARSSRRRSPTAKVAEFDKTISSKWGCTSCHSVTNGSKDDDRRRPSGRTSRTSATGRRSRATSIPMKLDELTKWIYDAPGHKPAGPLEGWMPDFVDDGHDQGAGRGDRQVPAVRHLDRSLSRIRSAADMTTVEDAGALVDGAGQAEHPRPAALDHGRVELVHHGRPQEDRDHVRHDRDVLLPRRRHRGAARSGSSSRSPTARSSRPRATTSSSRCTARRWCSSWACRSRPRSATTSCR